MTIRQIWKSITRERRVKKAIRKIKTNHVEEQRAKDKDNLDAEFSEKYNIDLRKSSKYNYETYKSIPIM